MKTNQNNNKDHQQAILQFLDTYEHTGTQDRLWQMFRLTLSSPEANDWNEIDRANWFHFYELLTGLVQANYFLVKRKNNGF